MAIANPTLDYKAGERPSAPTMLLNVSFDGDANYPAGGTAGFKASVLAACKAANPPLNIDVTNVVAVLGVKTGGYKIEYNRSTDKLLVFWCAAAGSPMAEVTASTDLHLVRFEVVVVVK